MRPKVTLREALSDPDLLGDILVGPSWDVWKTILIAAMGEMLTDDERIVFKQFTGREREPGKRVSELEVIAGRRGGKTRAMALLAGYIAALCDHTDALIAGETGVLLCVAQTQSVAKKILEFVESDFKNSPILSQLVKGRTQDAIELRNSITIEVKPASFRNLRGPTYICMIADELGFWFTEDAYAHPDAEILAAVRPGLLTTHGPLIMASSPYAKKGALWDTFRRHFGPNGSPNILVAKGTTREFNPTIDQSEIDEALRRDRARNTAELLAEFRSDLEAYVSLEIVEACLGDYGELAPTATTNYFAFVDPAGGTADSFSMSVGHKQGNRVIIDCVREVRPPFVPDVVVEDFCRLLKSYRVGKVVGDHWAGGFPPTAFQKHGIRYEQAKQAKSDIYKDALALLNSYRITMPRNDRLVNQLVSLERRVSRGGPERIDHPDGHNMHDDLANAVCGCAVVGGIGYSYDFFMGETFDDDEGPQTPKPPQFISLVPPAGRPRDMFTAGIAGYLDERHQDMIFDAADAMPPLQREHLLRCIGTALKGKPLPTDDQIRNAISVANALTKLALDSGAQNKDQQNANQSQR